MAALLELEKAIARWEESVGWILGPWDCIEEYTLGLSDREDLDDVLIGVDPDTVPDDLLARIRDTDHAFRAATIETRLCVWLDGAQYDYDETGNPFPDVDYPRDRYWYYYRWPRECLAFVRKYDVRSYEASLRFPEPPPMAMKDLLAGARDWAEEALLPRAVRQYGSRGVTRSDAEKVAREYLDRSHPEMTGAVLTARSLDEVSRVPTIYMADPEAGDLSHAWLVYACNGKVSELKSSWLVVVARNDGAIWYSGLANDEG